MSTPPPGDKRHELERRLTVAHHLPSLAFFSFVAVGVSVAVLWVWPVTGGTRRSALAAQQVSNHHRMIAATCERCHAAPFTGASDDRCLSCHAVGSHAEAFTAKKVHTVDRCASCHKEHHGERSLVPADSPLCTRCHSQIAKLLPGTRQPSVNDFAHHPEFRLVSEGARDTTVLKFSHAEHLGILQREGGAAETLTCGSCHLRTRDGKSFTPIAFVKNCQRCHKLDFDPRIKGTPVPHGNTEHAIEVIRAALAEFSLNSNEGSRETTAALRDRVERETRDVVDAVFTEVDGCKRCHEVTVTAAPGSPDRKQYKVDPPHIRARWLPAARFDHGVHRQTACEQCHTRARTSKSASDLLVPGIGACRGCHADPGTPDKVESPCVECHVYHAKE